MVKLGVPFQPVPVEIEITIVFGAYPDGSYDAGSIINKRSPVLRNNITQVISSFIYLKKKKRDLTPKISIMCVYICIYIYI